MTLLDILKIIDPNAIVALHVYGVGVVYDEHMGNVGDMPLRLFVKYMTYRVTKVSNTKKGKIDIHIESWMKI